VTNVARCARTSNICPDSMVLGKWQRLVSRRTNLYQTYAKRLSTKVTGHRTSAVISSNFNCPEAFSPPQEVHFFLSYEDWTTSYWSYEDDYKLVGEREAIAEPTPSVGVSSSYVTDCLSLPKAMT
jgi:hypothetical protein